MPLTCKETRKSKEARRTDASAGMKTLLGHSSQLHRPGPAVLSQHRADSSRCQDRNGTAAASTPPCRKRIHPPGYRNPSPAKPHHCLFHTMSLHRLILFQNLFIKNTLKSKTRFLGIHILGCESYLFKWFQARLLPKPHHVFQNSFFDILKKNKILIPMVGSGAAGGRGPCTLHLMLRRTASHFGTYLISAQFFKGAHNASLLGPGTQCLNVRYHNCYEKCL